MDGGKARYRSLRTAVLLHRSGHKRQLPIAGGLAKNVTQHLGPDASATAHAQAEGAGG